MVFNDGLYDWKLHNLIHTELWPHFLKSNVTTGQFSTSIGIDITTVDTSSTVPTKRTCSFVDQACRTRSPTRRMASRCYTSDLPVL